MKIKELNLTAFGPFTDRILIFDKVGLHIVYGRNEAGKSSALRGLKALLYGIKERTLDNFRHSNDKLRVSGSLRTSDGHELTFTRRKGRKHTLLSSDGDVLDKQVLAPFLRGVSPDIFEMLFGIDHQALVQGGQEILEQKGEVGQALFSAALGSHALHALLAQLDDEADALFRPRGSTQIINSALVSFAQLKKEIKKLSLSSREWDEHRRTLRRTTKALNKIQSELADNRAEVNRLQRIQRISPKLARRSELLQELVSLGDVVILPDDFTARRQQALKALETAQAIVGKAIPRLAESHKQLETLSINQKLLEHAEDIEDIHARLGGYRKIEQERPILQAERQQLLIEAESLLKEVRPDLELKGIEVLRSVLARRHTINELSSENAVLLSHLEQAESNRRETETRLMIARKKYREISASGSTSALRRTIVAARKQGDMDAVIQSTDNDLGCIQAQCAADLSRLTLWDGALDDLPGLGVPNRESINRFEHAYDNMRSIHQRLEEKKAETADSLHEASYRLDEIQRIGRVPSEADLIAVRSERDQLWQLLRRQWVEGEDISHEEASRFVAEKGLTDRFEYLLSDADELSDRMRREVDRVHTVASLQAQQEAAQQQLAQINQQLETYTVEKDKLDTDWRKLWEPCQIVPHTPREMRVWVDEMVELRDRVEQMNVLRRKRGELERTRKSHIQQLNRQLQELGKKGSLTEQLEPTLLECEEVAQQLEETVIRRDALNREIKQREADLESLLEAHRLAMKKLEAWNRRWHKLIRSCGLSDDASSSEVGDFIEKVGTLFKKKSDADDLRIRIQLLDEDADAFRKLVASMSAVFAPQLDDSPTDEVVTHFNSLLAENRSRQTKRLQIKKQLEQAQKEIEDSKLTIQIMTDQLDALCAEAKCVNHNELIDAERRSTLYLQTKAAIEKLESEILETGEGANIAELEREAAEVNPDILPARIIALNNKIKDELEPRRIELAERKGREEKELELMDGSDQAAALADQAHAVLAGIRHDAELYIRVKIAGRVLRDQIERYRKENQGPLVKRASEHFAILTLGSFAELMVDFNEKDEPVLVGIRPDRERVYVEGMSSGTRDQLYLALRLASLEKYMENSEPMPFIVDDVLVDFDDMRSQAALNLLLTLAEKTQVILFTHHSQVVEQSKQLHGSVQVHEL